MQEKKEEKSLRRVYRQAIIIDQQAQQELLLLAEAANSLRNLAIEQARTWLAMETGDPAKKAVTAFSLNYWLTDVRRENPALTNNVMASDLMLTHARQTLVYVAGAFSSFFELKKRGDTRAKPPKTYQWPCSIPLSWPADSVKLENNILYIKGRSNGQRVEIPLPSYLARSITGKTLAYVRLKLEENQWRLELTVKFPTPALRPLRRAIASDIGAGYVALATSCGKEAIIPVRRPDKLAKKRVGTIEKRQSGRIKGSRGYNRLAKARRQIFGQVEDRQKDYQRKLAAALFAEADLVIVGQSTVRLGLSQSEKGAPKQHWGSQNTGYMARLIQLLEIEAAETGGQLLKLPDPERSGSLKDPDAKIAAARTLLCKATSLGLAYPAKFKQVKWRFNQ